MTAVLQRPAPPAVPATRSPARSIARRTHPLWFLIPAFVLLGVFFLLPTLFNFIYAFTDWSSFKAAINPVGFDNFSDLALLSAVRITLVYAALVAIFQNVFGFGLAVLLERDTTVNRILRVAFLIPVLMSALAVGYVFQALFKPGAGLGFEHAWLGDTTWTIVVVALIHAWKWMGLSMLIYLAGLKTIPAEVIEAAHIDGASRWRSFWSVRFPLLAPAVTFNVATALLGSMNGFDIVQATTGGGPARTTEILNIFIYRTFGQGLFAQATAMSLVLFLLVALLAFPVITLLRRREEVL
ncbi:carbohydrate ABC transporter permease [Actinoplanes aureus]|uniref:Sugar ABC transporter permease n=1 Tax=Actinoplanes aureus TaxID=2792083 RepID=A0A931CEN5_9ACTN|nr:sugar ABC transporter permease [Actinoplanes aureus]MBG0568505.1 sugar ABC transporter permease [Actinoplanes aureus]